MSEPLILKALALSVGTTIEADRVIVPGRSQAAYVVRAYPDLVTCSCEAGQRLKPCSHRLAAGLRVQAAYGKLPDGIDLEALKVCAEAGIEKLKAAARMVDDSRGRDPFAICD